MQTLTGKVAWVTGAGTGIGEAGAAALAEAGMTVVLSGRRAAPLEAVAQRLNATAAGKARVQAADLSQKGEVKRIADVIKAELGRLDVVVNNAGCNIPERAWRNLTADGIDTLIQGNLTSAFYVVAAALPIMRAQGDGLFIHTASWAGRFIGPVSGPGYTAAKHGMVAMSHTINLEECMHGIRSCVVCPGEVATPILKNRPIPETAETMARMLQPDDMGQLIAFIAKQPGHVCINEVLISPTYNRGYIGTMKAREAALAAAGKT
ncbi:MAG TPA: SDR family NAD(P)-dependent oxidoreductase [Hyphomicrobiaceae bacterium]|nr:SDR family NAD(P)-dependent oxidoreductase [Hyphomicrobiaceae bacterium]